MSKELIERLRGAEVLVSLQIEAADLIEAQQSWIDSLEAHARDADRMYKELETQVDQLQWENKGIAEWREIALAAQAQIKVMREALEAMVMYAREEGKGLRIADEALAQPTNDSALRELLKAERERCAKVCDEIHSFHFVANPAELCAINIRAMEDQ